uniref:Uncharacterized protein n=1 Tax=Picea sitchensis TaxID=3332 RepID=A0A6B9XXN4_PICSI|nr:hypothetical protein Q903MT_gene6752 [Picea sitchensis]
MFVWLVGSRGQDFQKLSHLEFCLCHNLSHTVERLLSSPLTLVPRMSASAFCDSSMKTTNSSGN